MSAYSAPCCEVNEGVRYLPVDSEPLGKESAVRRSDEEMRAFEEAPR